MLVDASWIREVFIGGENNPISHPTPTQLGDKAPAASPSAPKDPKLLQEGDREGKKSPQNPPKPFGGYLESLGLRPPALPVLLRAPCPSSTCSGPGQNSQILPGVNNPGRTLLCLIGLRQPVPCLNSFLSVFAARGWH